MNKHLFILSAAALVLGAASCQKADITESFAAGAPLKTIMASSAGLDTRLALDEATLCTRFEEGDKIFGWDSEGTYAYSCTPVWPAN